MNYFPRGSLKPLFYIFFLFSGFSGLIYESIWSHYLKLFLGHAAYAQTLVLVIFMGGMAIGAMLCARLSGKWRNTLLAYAIVEGIIGVLALIFHQTFVSFTEYAYLSVIPSLDSALAVDSFKWFTSSLLILPQSILLGMTFPLMVSGILRRYPEGSGRAIATLYFANSLGAAVGVMVSGFYLINKSGLPGTIETAGMINIALAVIVGALALKQREQPESFPAGSDKPEEGATSWYKIMLSIALLTGLASFIYEIVWIRMLSLVLSSSTHSFELMLSAFIFGLAAGGWWIRKRLDKLDNPILTLGKIQIFMGLLALATLPVYGWTFEWMQSVMGMLTKTGQSWVMFNVLSHLMALAVMLPATFCAGMTLPLVTACLIRKGTGEKSIGAVYGANTIGAILGVLFAVHIGMPNFGLKNLLAMGCAIDIGLGLYLLYKYRDSFQASSLRLIAGVATVLFVAGVGMFGLDHHKMASGVYRMGKLLTEDMAEIVYQKDGKTSTVNFIRHNDGLISLTTNGKPEASMMDDGSGRATLDESTMIMAATVPLAVHPQAKKVANIGFGSGLTTHTLLAVPWLERVDTIEIEPAIVEGASHFGDRVKRAYTDPRSVIHYEDAKTYFAAHGERYDIIISEPSNPWVSGVSGLFSDEFYGLITRHLEKDGVFVQWFQLYEIDISMISTILKALGRHFEHYEIYAADYYDLLIIAKHKGTIAEPDEAVLKQPQLAADLKRIGIYSKHDLEIRHLAGRRSLEPLFAAGKLPYNSDYYPILDQIAGRARFMGSNADDLGKLGYAPLPVLAMLDRRKPTWPSGKITENQYVPVTSVVANARAMFHYLATGQANERFKRLPAKSRINAEFLYWRSKNCIASSDADSLINAMVAVAYQVIPFIWPDDFVAMWDAIDWRACEGELSPVQKNWNGLIRAVATQDAREMARLANTLLATDRTAELDRYGYLLMAGMLGHLAQDQHAASMNLWQRYSASVYGKGKKELDQVLYLLATHGSFGVSR